MQVFFSNICVAPLLEDLKVGWWGEEAGREGGREGWHALESFRLQCFRWLHGAGCRRSVEAGGTFWQAARATLAHARAHL